MAPVATPHDPAPPGWRARAVARLLRRYPLVSGGGLLANHPLTRSLAGRPGGLAWAEVRGGRMLVALDEHVGNAAFFFGDLDPKVTWCIERAVEPGDTVLDIGCNLGLVSLHLAARVGPSGRVHAFEPNPRLAPLLAATLAANPDRPITLHRVALGAEEGTQTLTVPRGNFGGASLKPQDGGGAVDRHAVPVRRLDAWAAEQGLDRLDFVKIDVEGFEAQVLEGGRAILSALCPRALVLEENRPILSHGLPPALALLAGFGYALFALPRRLLRVEAVPLDRLPPGARVHDVVAIAPGERGAGVRARMGL